ncbi:MAG: HAD-IIIA family hydrolase [Deltaproteobacteria bacterium]|nr:HAD-IIIA family hydrolase [Deltaproteobacteria bacterium]
MARRAVFLDRDGVLNEPIIRSGRAFAPLSMEQFRLVDSAVTDVKRVKAAGLLCIVVTNQPEIASGQLSAASLETMHRHLKEQLNIEDIFVCGHGSEEGCVCRKPRPGMIHQAANLRSIDLGSSFVVGDRWRDIDAGRAVGCYTVLIERAYSECASADARVGSLTEAVDVILERL